MTLPLNAPCTARLKLHGLLALCMTAFGVQAQQADVGCGNPFANGYGPYDYRTDGGQLRKIVEDYHFTPRVESLISGQSGSIGGDLDYTLRAFPNHHRALVAMMNLGARTKSGDAPGAQFSVECYFKRAVQFRPDDLVARMLFAKYLGANRRKPDAVKQLDFVVQRAGDNGFTHFNAGMVFLELGEMDRTLVQAHRALELGFLRMDLRDKLQAAGKWVEPVAPASAASAPEAAASR